MAKVKTSWIFSLGLLIALIAIGTTYNLSMFSLTIGGEENITHPHFVVERYLIRDGGVQEFETQDLQEGDRALLHVYSLKIGTFYKAWFNSKGPRGSYPELVLKHKRIKAGQVLQVNEKLAHDKKGYQLSFLFCSGKEVLSPFSLEKGFKGKLDHCQQIPFY